MVVMLVMLSGSLPCVAATLDPNLVAFMAELFADGGYGRLSTERAAFLVVRADGTLECRVWPAGAAFQSASFRGRVPAGTLAIMHTHPNERREPSRIDRDLARRMNLPVIVVTRSAVVVAAAGTGALETLLSGDWSAGHRPLRNCSPVRRSH